MDEIINFLVLLSFNLNDLYPLPFACFDRKLVVRLEPTTVAETPSGDSGHLPGLNQYFPYTKSNPLAH